MSLDITDSPNLDRFGLFAFSGDSGVTSRSPARHTVVI